MDEEALNEIIDALKEKLGISGEAVDEWTLKIVKIAANQSKRDKIATDDFDSLSMSMRESTDEQDAFVKVAKNLKNAWDQVKTSASQITSQFASITSEVTKSGESFGLLRGFIKPVSEVLGAVITGFTGMVSGLLELGSEIPFLGKLLSGLGKALASVGAGLGKAASSIFEFSATLVLDSVEQLWTMFEGAASAGVLFANGLSEMNDQRGKMRLTTEEYLDVIKGSREQLTMFGGSVGEGAKRLADVGKESRKFQQDLRGMGITYKEQAENTIEFMASMQRTGHLRAMSDEQIAFQSAEYSKNLQVMSAMTGKSVDTMKQERNEALKNMAFQAKLAQMDPVARIEMEKALAGMPAGLEQAFKESVIFGKVMTDTGAIVTGTSKYIEEYANAIKNGSSTQAEAFESFRMSIKSAGPELRANLQKLAAVGMAELLGKGNAVTSNISKFSIGLYDLLARAENTQAGTIERQLSSGAKQDNAIKSILSTLDSQREMQDLILSTIKDKAMPAVAALMKLTQEGLTDAIKFLISTINSIGNSSTTTSTSTSTSVLQNRIKDPTPAQSAYSNYAQSFNRPATPGQIQEMDRQTGVLNERIQTLESEIKNMNEGGLDKRTGLDKMFHGTRGDELENLNKMMEKLVSLTEKANRYAKATASKE